MGINQGTKLTQFSALNVNIYSILVAWGKATYDKLSISSTKNGISGLQNGAVWCTNGTFLSILDTNNARWRLANALAAASETGG
jgi:hypothetical protein